VKKTAQPAVKAGPVKQVVAEPTAKAVGATSGQTAVKPSKPTVAKPAAEQPALVVEQVIIPIGGTPTIPKNVSKKSVAKRMAKPARPVVREDESPWTSAELRQVRAELRSEIKRLEEEVSAAEAGLADLIRDSGDGAGDDQADAGSKTFEREHEMSLANNARDGLLQVHHALERLDKGTYGACESCGKPVGKHRLQAFPRATLCLSCKEAEERY